MVAVRVGPISTTPGGGLSGTVSVPNVRGGFGHPPVVPTGRSLARRGARGVALPQPPCQGYDSTWGHPQRDCGGSPQEVKVQVRREGKNRAGQSVSQERYVRPDTGETASAKRFKAGREPSGHGSVRMQAALIAADSC